VVLISLFLVCAGVIVWAIWFKPGSSDPPVRPRQPLTEVERLYYQAESLYHRKDYYAARDQWQNLVAVFKDQPELTPSERRLISNAEQELNNLKGFLKDDIRWVEPLLALQRARILAAEDNWLEADRIVRGIWGLYEKEPAAQVVRDTCKDVWDEIEKAHNRIPPKQSP
jgi:hypothetical protein